MKPSLRTLSRWIRRIRGHINPRIDLPNAEQPLRASDTILGMLLVFFVVLAAARLLTSLLGFV